MNDTINPTVIPAELRALRQWVVWKYETRDGKPTKVLYNAMTHARADSTDPATWTDFESAREVSPRGYAGVGFVFAAGGGIVGIDLDDSLDDSGKPKPWAAALLRRFPTYTEVSPSGKGVKLWARGEMPGGHGRRRPYKDGAVEMYGKGRFFTVTGRRLDNAPESLAELQPQIDGLFDVVFSKALAPPTKLAAPNLRPPASADDQAIIDKLLGENGGKAAQLWSGIWNGHYKSQSEADAGLCAKIAFYTGNDHDRIDRIFRQSELSDDKWTSRPDYRLTTITGAVAKVGEFYKWNGNGHAQKTKPTIDAPPEQSTGLLKLIEDTISGKRRNLSWGWPQLSRAARALMPGTITVICGGGGSSKSLMLSQACLAWLVHDVSFAVFHLEEDREFHQYRALAQLESNSKLQDDVWVRANADEVRSAYERHMTTLDALGQGIWDAPRSEVSMADLTDWVRDRAGEGRRIIAIDPVTAADSGPEPWHADRRFVLDCKMIMRDAESSLIVVTHPRDGNPKHGSQIDNIAGGRAWNRFTQSVLMLESHEKEAERSVRRFLAGHEVTEVKPVNRSLRIRKARSGPGQGAELGFYFDGSSLLFTEQGAIVRND